MDFAKYAQLITGDLQSLFIQNDTYAEYACEIIGGELDGILLDLDDEPIFPLATLFGMLLNGWSLDVETLRADDGKFYTDYGVEIPDKVPKTLTPAEQMAAYGLFLIHFDSYLEESESPLEMVWEGWNDEEIISHISTPGNSSLDWKPDSIRLYIAERVIKANQALGYAHILATGTKGNTQAWQSSQSAIISKNASRNGKIGADIKLGPLRDLKKWSIAKYHEKEWRSANSAAYELMSEILEHGKTLGVVLAKSNAQRTIANWFRNSGAR